MEKYQILESSGEWVDTHKPMYDRFPTDRRRQVMEQWQVFAESESVRMWQDCNANEASEYDDTGSMTRCILRIIG